MKLGIESRGRPSLESQNDLGYLIGFHSAKESEQQIRYGAKDVAEDTRQRDSLLDVETERD